jgi:hypothetical protein
MMNKSIKLNHKKDQINWHISYKKLANLLYQFANHYKEETSKQLFTLCMNDSEFRDLNRW